MPKYSPSSMKRRKAQGDRMLNALKNVASGVKKKVIGATSDVISAPARAYYGAKGAQASRDAAIIRQARAYDDAPNFDDKGQPSDAFKARTVADAVKDKYKKK